MDARKRKFELLPAFLKAGVYYSTKLEGVRHADIPYYQRLFAYELIMKNAKVDFLHQNYESACRKYEEVRIFYTFFKVYDYRRIVYGGFIKVKIRTGPMKASTTAISRKSTGKVQHLKKLNFQDSIKLMVCLILQHAT